jgi:redox-sensitive bicupin YhaK (pirin superfamily)
MVAGSGIVHSERTPVALRTSGHALEGLQLWLALPEGDEEVAPLFEHHAVESLPVVTIPGGELLVIAGSAYGERAPTGVLSETLFVHARLDADAVLRVDDQHEERAAYVVRGTVECDDQSFEPGTLIVFRPGCLATLRARTAAHVVLLGGARLEGSRHLWWNFVSSSRERIEQAKADWREGRFAGVPGDDREFIPLPE